MIDSGSSNALPRERPSDRLNGMASDSVPENQPSGEDSRLAATGLSSLEMFPT